MNRTFRAKAIVVAVILTVFGIGGTVSTAAAAYSGVIVRNSYKQPIPVKGTVSIGNKPTVYAVQSGTWKTQITNVPNVGFDPLNNGVTVQNTPNVNVMSLPSVKIDSSANTVTVANGPSNPLYVTPGCGRTPFLRRIGGSFPSGQSTSFDYEVPAGEEWLVIKTIGWPNMYDADARLDIVQQGVVVASFTSPVGGNSQNAGTSACEIPVAPGSTVRFTAHSNSGDVFYLGVAGYTTATP